MVPADAVIPAPIAYIKIVAVKKLVVETLVAGRPAQMSAGAHCHPPVSGTSAFTGRPHKLAFYLEKNRVFQAGLSGMH